MAGQTVTPSALLPRLRDCVDRAFVQNQLTTAIFWAEKAATLSRGEEQDVFQLARAYALSQQHQRAIHTVQSNGLAQTSLRCLHLAGESLRLTSKHEEALALIGREPGPLEVAGEKDPAESSILSCISLLRARCLETLGNRHFAVQAYRRALALDVLCFDALDDLVSFHMLSGSEERALVAQLPVASQVPEAASVVAALYACRLKKYDGSFSLASLKVPSELSNNLDVLVAQAESLFYGGRIQQCLELTTKILDLDPYLSACLPLHIACLVEMRDVNGLFYLSHRLVDSHAEKAIAWYSVGCYSLLTKNNDAARRHFEKATRIDVHFGPAWLGFGHAFSVDREHDQAMAAYCTAARYMSGCHLPLLYVGMEYTQTKNLVLAQEYLQEALAIAPHDPLVHNELGVVALKQNDVDAAEVSFRKALALYDAADCKTASVATEPVLVNLARTLLKRQQYDESISLCRKALVACPRNAGTVALMAYAHHCAQRFDQAIDLYHQALSLDASHVFSGQMLKIALEEAMSSNDALSEAMAGMSEEAESSFMDGAHIAESSPSFALPPIRAAPQHLDESVHSSEMSFV